MEKFQLQWASLRQCSGSSVGVGPLGAEERLQGEAVGLQRDLDVQPPADGGQHVHRLGEGIDHPAPRRIGGRVGVDDDQRHVERLVPVAELLEQPVVAPHLAVIAGEHHQGGGGQAGAVEVVEEPAQLVVDLPLGAVVGGPHLPALHLVLGGAGGGQVHEDLIEGMGRRLLRLGRRPGERRQVVGVVEVVVAGRIAAGRMGADERGVDEEGLVAVALQPSGDRLHHEGGLGVLGGEPGRGPASSRGGRPRRIPAPVGRGRGDGRGRRPPGRPATRPTAGCPPPTDRGPRPGSRAAPARRSGAGDRRRAACAGRGWCRCTRTAPGRSRPRGPAGPRW